MTERVPKTRKKISLKEKRRRTRLFIFGSVGILVLVLVYVLVYVVRLPEVTIQTVNIEGMTYTRADLVETVVRESMKGSYLFLVPKSNAFFYPRKEIEEKIKNTFYTVESVRLQKRNLTMLTVRITDRVPVAYWCSGIPDVVPCYVLDKDGLVFMRHDEHRQPFITYSGNLSSNALGKTYIEGQFASLRDFIKNVAEITGRTPHRVHVNEQNDVSVFFAEGGEVRYVLEEQNITLLDNIASVFASRRFQSDNVLEYADFRFGSNVYVQFVGDE